MVNKVKNVAIDKLYHVGQNETRDTLPLIFEWKAID